MPSGRILVRLVVSGEFEEQAETIWTRILGESRLCVVPAFCPTEIISSIRQMGRGGMLTADEEAAAVRDFVNRIRPGLTTIDSPALTMAAWEIARDLNERHTYDSVYLAVARAFGMEFWTTGRQLLRHLDNRFAEAHFLGDYPLGQPAA